MTGTDCMYQKGESELTNIEDCKDTSIRGHEVYIKKSKERLNSSDKYNSSDNLRTKKTATKTKKQKWEEKQLYGYFKGQTSEIPLEKIWT